MATNGSKSITVTSWNTLKFSWWENSQSIANNTTTIGWKMELIATSDGRIDSSASKKWTVVVNGTTYSGTNTVGISNNATKTLASGTTTIKHDSNGKKTFSYSFSQQFSITFSGSNIGTKSGSGSGTLDTIARNSSLTAGNGTLGTAQTLTISRQDSSFTHTITYTCGSASGTIATKTTSTSVSFTPPLSLASQAPSATSVSVTLKMTTYSGDTSIGTVSKTITCSIPSSVKPTVSIAVSDAAGFLSTYGSYVQRKSKLKITITASGAYGSSIKSYTTAADGKTYTSASITTEVLSGSGSLTVTTKVTDSRGRTATASKTITVLAYDLPKITALSVKRCNSDGTINSGGAYLAVTFSAQITSLSSKNSAAYSIEYKKASETNFTTESLADLAGQFSVSNGVFIFAADIASSYEVRFIAKDSFTETRRAASGSSASKLFSILAQGLGLAFGKIAELQNVFDIAFQTRFSGGILQPILPDNTDLDAVMTPNTYTGRNAGRAGYLNCPVDVNATFVLEVFAVGDAGQVMQRLTIANKKEPLIYIRCFYSSGWGAWMSKSIAAVDWTNLTLSSGFVPYGNNAANHPRYKVSGNVVTVTGTVSPATAYQSSNDPVVFASGIPAEYCPDYRHAFLCQGSGFNRWMLTIETDGTLSVSRYGSTGHAEVGTSAWLIFTATYQF